MKIRIALTTISFVASSLALAAYGQNSPGLAVDWNFEFQAYPTGLIPGVRFEGAKGRNAVHLRLGYNWIRHGDAGKHDDERGRGYGFTLGYRRYFRDGQKGFFTGLRHDFWFNEIEWKDDEPAATGMTEITVSQPTLEAGWLFILNEKLIFAPSLAWGYEINIVTDGEPTGEGMILLAGINLGYRIRK